MLLNINTTRASIVQYTNVNISVKVCLVPQPMFCIEMEPDGVGIIVYVDLLSLGDSIKSSSVFSEPDPEHPDRSPNVGSVTDLAQDKVDDVVGDASPWS